MSLKFIHAADLHLDSPMRGLGATDPEIAATSRDASRRAFERLIDVALEEEVAFVVVAGDIFDGDWDDLATGLWTIRQLRRLEARRVPVFISLGNHDLQNKTLPKLTWPKNVKIFNSKKPETFFYPDDLPTLFDGAPKRARKNVANKDPPISPDREWKNRNLFSGAQELRHVPDAARFRPVRYRMHSTAYGYSWQRSPVLPGFYRPTLSEVHRL